MRATSFTPGANRHKPAKQTRNRVPPPQRERILQKHATGKSILQISKEERRNRETVSKIVRGPEMQNLVRKMRERFYGLASDGIDAVEHALTEQKDGRLAFQLLASLGVIPSPEERRLLAASEIETGNDEEAGVKRVMAGLIEQTLKRASMFGYRATELEDDVRKAGGRINYETGELEPLIPLKKKTAT